MKYKWYFYYGTTMVLYCIPLDPWLTRKSNTSLILVITSSKTMGIWYDIGHFAHSLCMVNLLGFLGWGVLFSQWYASQTLNAVSAIPFHSWLMLSHFLAEFHTAKYLSLEHVKYSHNAIFTGIPRITQSNSYTAFIVWVFMRIPNDALWDIF